MSTWQSITCRQNQQDVAASSSSSSIPVPKSDFVRQRSMKRAAKHVVSGASRLPSLSAGFNLPHIVRVARNPISQLKKEIIDEQAYHPNFVQNLGVTKEKAANINN